MVTRELRARRGTVPLGFVVVGVVPYVAVKLHWLTGGSAGVRFGVDMHSPALTIANLLTLVLDLVVVAVAWTLYRTDSARVVRRLGPLVWGAVGLMAMPVLTSLTAAVLGSATGPFDLAPWVFVVVYGSFAAQMCGLLWLLLLRVGNRGRGPAPQRLLVRVAVTCALVAGAAQLAMASGVAVAAGSGPVDRAADGVSAVLCVAAALGSLTMHRQAAGYLAVAFLASGAMTCWSGYLLIFQVLGGGLVASTAAVLAGTLLAGAAVSMSVRRECLVRLGAPIRHAKHGEPSGFLTNKLRV